MVVSLYRDRLFVTSGRRSNKLFNQAAVFAEVVVDIPARELGDKLFTYRVPDYLQSETFIGAQVLVPFGGQELVGGYVVAIKDTTSGEFKLKDVVDVLDNDPLFDRYYVEFLYWVAEYYCASLSSVIQAAVPADFGPLLAARTEVGYHAVYANWTFEYVAIDPPLTAHNAKVEVIAADGGPSYGHAY